jgi:molecular chaperone IbpA
MTRFTTLYPQFVGFDQLFNELERLVEGQAPTRNTSFPPHNVIKVDDSHYVVELAVAGFAKDEIDIELDDGLLVVKGEKKDKDTEVTYIHRGIGTRSFTKSLTIADTVEVRGAEFKDGILRIGLENVIPEHKKPRKIEIGNGLKLPKPQLLQEKETV